MPKRALFLTIALALAAPVMGQGRPDCATVLRELHRTRTRHKVRVPDADRVAERLHTEPEWVERCAQSYGRRVKRGEQAHDRDTDVALKERREAEEYEELGREERATMGDTYFTTIENDAKDRKKLRRARNADSISEWEPYETHEWEPNLGHAWPGPFIHDDDHPNEE